jgi:hypothetical protein
LATKVKVNVDFKKIRMDIIKEVQRTLPRTLKTAIVDQHILKGKSPVAGQGRFKKYSKSYIDQIRNKVAFRSTKNGGVIAIGKEGKHKIGDLKAAGMSSAVLKEARRLNKGIDEQIKDMNKNLTKFGKRPSPVNFKVSGSGINSFFVSRIAKGLKIGFSSKLSKYFHFGRSGKNSQPPRPLLPLKKGQKFSSKITKRINNILAIAVKRAIRKSKGFS